MVFGKISPKTRVSTNGIITVKKTDEVVPTIEEMTFCTPKFTVIFKIRRVTNNDLGFSNNIAATFFPLLLDCLNVFLFEGESEKRAVSEEEKNALHTKRSSNPKMSNPEDITLICPIK